MIKPATPDLQFSFRITAEIGEVVSGGAGLRGEQLHIPIIGGAVRGEAINGRILPGGSDWPVSRPDGHTDISATYTILTDDGVPILVRNDGLRRSTPEVVARMRAGEIVPVEDYYFRTAPRFEAPDGRYAWMRETLFVCSIAPQPPLIEIDVYEVV